MSIPLLSFHNVMQTSPPSSFSPSVVCRDESGTISYDEFKNVFNANIGPDAIPFDFDWYARVSRFSVLFGV